MMPEMMEMDDASSLLLLLPSFLLLPPSSFSSLHSYSTGYTHMIQAWPWHTGIHTQTGEGIESTFQSLPTILHQAEGKGESVCPPHSSTHLFTIFRPTPPKQQKCKGIHIQAGTYIHTQEGLAPCLLAFLPSFFSSSLPTAMSPEKTCRAFSLLCLSAGYTCHTTTTSII